MEIKNGNSSCNIQILTPTGFQFFHGIRKIWHDEYITFEFEDGSIIDTAFLHKFIINNKQIFAQDLVVGQNIGKTISKITEHDTGAYFYDPLGVENGAIFNHDSKFISHNSFFGTGDTLIDANTLMGLKAAPPIRRMGDVLIYKETEKFHEYVMLVDVAKGRNQDYSTFNIIDISVKPFEQVACYRNNKISPILFPNEIYKWAKAYNEAYVIIESNDQGTLVCNGLYHDLEYENVHFESAVSSKRVGVEMTKKVKRIGCSGFKTILEAGGLLVHDEETIKEITTFEARGNSYEASDGNNDDLVMNLVMFGYFTGTKFFANVSDVNLRQMLYEERIKQIEEDVVPFGFIVTGLEDEEDQLDGSRSNWSIVKSDDYYPQWA